MKIAMNPVPMSMAAGYNTVRPGIDAASNTPSVASKQPIINGLRIPIRSITRPMGTASSMGNNANSAINVPTVNAEACSDSAYSAVVTRAAPSATCAVTATAISRKSGEDKDTVKNYSLCIQQLTHYYLGRVQCRGYWYALSVKM